jgi:hypothetical protein
LKSDNEAPKESGEGPGKATGNGFRSAPRSEPRSGLGGEAGVFLVDLMIGAMVSVVLIGAVLSIVVHQGQMRQANTETSLALSAAINSVEQLRTVPQAVLPALDGTGFDVPGPNGAPGGLRAVPGDPDGLPGQLTVAVESTAGGETLYRVVASVAWVGVTGRRTYALETLLGERK